MTRRLRCADPLPKHLNQLGRHALLIQRGKRSRPILLPPLLTLLVANLAVEVGNLERGPLRDFSGEAG